MALRQILLPWDAQPAERVQPDAAVAGWGTMVVASSWPVELVNQAPIAQLNGTYLTRVVPSRVGPAIAPVSGSGVAAATWMPAPDMGAIIGASLLWHGVITAASGSSTTTGLFGRYSTTSGGAGYVGQFFLRVTTAGKIQVEINNGAGPVAYTTGLTVVYGEPLTILVRFTAAGADILSTVGAESVSISSMASAVGIYTPGIFASVGADRWNYTGHPYQQTALAAWARTHIPPQCVREPWSVLEPQRIIVAVAAGAPGGTTYDVTMTEAASAGDASTADQVVVAALAESASGADGVGSVAVLLAALSEPVTAVDAASAGAASYAVTLTETGSAIDAVAAIMHAAAAIAEPASASDAQSAQAAMVVALTEAGGASEASNWGGAIYSASTEEAAAASDAVASVLQAAAAVAEAGTTGDLVAAVLSLTASSIEPAAAVDALIAALQLGAQITEAGSASDAMSGAEAAVYSVSLAESAAAVDVVIATIGNLAVLYPLAGVAQRYPLTGSMQAWPLAGATQDWPLS